MKTTPFTETHIALGAKMHEFAGYNMPIEYSGIIDEHMTVCNGVGVFDVSHMGEFWVKGPNALEFIQQVTSNNAAGLPIGKAQYTCFPNEEGGIVDDLLVYHYEDEKYLLVVNAANIEKDWNWCVSHNTVGAELENSSDRMAQLAIQGPKATEVLQRLTSVNLSEIPYYAFATGEFAGCSNVIISNTGYTGAGGFELYFYPEDGKKIWDAIFEAGAPEGIKPIGLGARDTLRLEMGFCLYGNDLSDTTSPLEAGLGWIGRQSLLITPEFGSYVLLGELVLDMEADAYDAPYEGVGCGECRRCMDACPTSAIVAPMTIDTSKCISCRTIESDNDANIDLHGWIFGCEECQNCCPYNRQAAIHRNEAFNPLFDPREISAEEWQAMNEEEFLARFGTTPLKRSRLERIKKNIKK